MSIQESMKAGWYLLKTKSRQEQRACYNLENQGFDAYSPVFYSKICEPKDEVLFPGYLFVHLDRNDLSRYHKIRSTRGILGIVSFNQINRKLYADGRISVSETGLSRLLPQPMPRGDIIIKQVREMIEHLNNRSEKSDVLFNKGDSVSICKPLYDHLKGFFVKGVSANRGIVLIQYIKEQRNSEGVMEIAEVTSLKPMTVNLADINKTDEL